MRPHPVDDQRGLALAVLDGVLGDDLSLADLWQCVKIHDARVAHLVLQQALGPGSPHRGERDLGARLHRPERARLI